MVLRASAVWLLTRCPAVRKCYLKSDAPDSKSLNRQRTLFTPLNKPTVFIWPWVRVAIATIMSEYSHALLWIKAPMSPARATTSIRQHSLETSLSSSLNPVPASQVRTCSPSVRIRSSVRRVFPVLISNAITGTIVSRTWERIVEMKAPTSALVINPSRSKSSIPRLYRSLKKRTLTSQPSRNLQMVFKSKKFHLGLSHRPATTKSPRNRVGRESLRNAWQAKRSLFRMGPRKT